MAREPRVILNARRNLPIAIDLGAVALGNQQPLSILLEALTKRWDRKQGESLRAWCAADVANFGPHTPSGILLQHDRHADTELVPAMGAGIMNAGDAIDRTHPHLRRPTGRALRSTFRLLQVPQSVVELL